MATHSKCSCLENPVDRGDWQGTVHGVAESDMTEHTTHTHTDHTAYLKSRNSYTPGQLSTICL